jgi:enolase-phosphatase E1
MDRLEPICISAQAVVTDIEGTTTPLAFVKEVLFPYARAHLPNFVAHHHEDPAVAEQLRLVCQIAGVQLGLRKLGNLLQVWIDQDRKIPPLKSLQAMVWEKGYQSGEIKGQIYPDAVHALKEWRQAGVPLYIYSSGSVQAQELLFRHSEHGNLSGLFSGHFDLAVGGKQDAKSYATIARCVGLPPQRILFVSDVVEELNAARHAGMQTVWMVREDNLPAQSMHLPVRSFGSINLSFSRQ